MKHHDYEDDEDEDFEEGKEGYEEELMAEALKSSKDMKDAEIALALRSLRSELLDKAIFIVKSHWTWWFMSNAKKMDKVRFAYKNLESLLD